jgi:hypothetical protein
LYPLPGKTRFVGHVEDTGGMRNVNKILIGELGKNRPLGRHKHKYDNFKIDI